MTRKSKKILSITLKLAVLALAFAFIYDKVSNNKGFDNFLMLTRDLSPRSVYKILAFLVGLMLVNWLLEAAKWRYLIKNVEPISWWRAIESVFCGLTWAVFTPNRLGEYGGRVLFLTPRKRVIGVVSMAVGALGQMVVTNVAGSLALLWFTANFLKLDAPVEVAIAFLISVYCVFFLLLYFNIRVIDHLLARVKFIKPFRRFFNILAKYSVPDLARIISFGIARYAVFTFQYYIIIHFLVPEIPATDTIMLLFIMYFIQAALPSLDLLDIGVRASTAGYLFSYVTENEVAIMAATACIWLINLIVPAILGSVFVLKLNFFGNSRN